MKQFILVLFLIQNIVVAQVYQITKIIDSNLFQLNDGRIIKLAGIDAASLISKNDALKRVATEAIEYCKINLLDRNVEISVLPKNSTAQYQLVFLYKNYLFEKVNISEKLIHNGYGKHFTNYPTNDSVFQVFNNCEMAAKKNKSGIWQFNSSLQQEIMDETFKVNSLLEIDSIFHYTIPPIKIKRPLLASIALETLVGSGMAVGGGLATAGLLMSFDDKSGGDLGMAFGYGIILGYTIGFASGVYLIAQQDNPDLSYWGIFGTTILTTAGMTFIAVTSNKHDDVSQLVFFLSPLISSLFYTHIISPSIEQENPNLNYLQSNRTSFYNYYNSTKLLNQELFRIHF